MVQCNTCKREYTPIEGMGDTDQAHDCSATLYLSDGEYYIVGHYGSKVADMQKYMLQSDTSYETGIICDNCIEELKNKKLAILVADGIWS
jgi:hypothetical protein